MSVLINAWLIWLLEKKSVEKVKTNSIPNISLIILIMLILILIILHYGIPYESL